MHAAEVLEFEALRALLGRYLRSPLGRGELASVTPSGDRATIETALAETSEGIEYLRAASQPQPAGRGAAIRVNFGDIVDPIAAVGRLRIAGATLDGPEIFELTRVLDLAAEVRGILVAAASRFPRLGAQGATIADLRELAHELSGKILPGGVLADHASVALARLRRDAEKQRQAIQHSLERFLRAHHEDGTLQEDFVTIRNDRFVVPVVTGRERRVQGVIHGASGSGHTLFVEPLETIELNNELVRLREEEAREVHRILREFTDRLRAHAPEIAATTRALARLEWIFAKAEFALEFRCVVPRISPGDRRRMIVREARHPLLEDILRRHSKAVVPVTFDLDGQQRTLLISGPNTGGKTVTLKTAGLLALMAHAGLPVPAADAEFPLFDDVLADIGDHQSLQESLSTFSAHIVAIRGMLEHATPDSLVLIDELGRATDPEEGGALGTAVLDAFLKRGSFTLASTHLVALKLYGASTAGVRNGSMGFDDATLQPTYVLRLGAPGKSAGLDIASRLGLDPALIQDARARLTTTERDIAHFLNEMQQKLDELESERSGVATKERALAAREQSLDQTWEKKFAAKIREVEDRAAELSAGFEKQAQETLGELSQKARVKITKTRREFQEAVEAAVETLTPKRAVAAGEPARVKLAEGVRVRLKGIRQPATVRRVLANGMLEVDAGFLKMKVPETEVEEVLAPAGAPAARPSVTFRQGPSFEGTFREINIVGQRAEEACAHVDKLLDSAALAAVDRIRIIHGHGMGILKRAVADLLAQHPHVEKFYIAPPEEGGSGATIVELKS
ncbi:MAG: endonuclease MutS2 [Bryobacterales bacterium]|nr:endonuclease MutS2 [Bryobacterales bacterium]